MTQVTIEREKKYYPEPHESGNIHVKVVVFEYELDGEGNRVKLLGKKYEREIYSPDQKNYDAEFQALMDKFQPQQQQDNLRLIAAKDVEINDLKAEKASLMAERDALKVERPDR